MSPRRSKREVARALEGLGSDDPPQRITVRREVVNEDGEVIATTTRDLDVGESP